MNILMSFVPSGQPIETGGTCYKPWHQALTLGGRCYAYAANHGFLWTGRVHCTLTNLHYTFPWLNVGYVIYLQGAVV